MVKKAIYTLFSLLITCFATCFSANGQDGERNVYHSVTSYLEAISTFPIDTIISRCDQLIASGEDVTTQSNLAGLIFNYFTTSPIMGREAVSVYIADNYFLNKKLPWGNDDTYPSLFTYAEFNRESLIGKEAPELIAESIIGEQINIRDIHSNYKILYFYESHCATCAKQTPLLINFLQNYSGEANISFIAFYTQDDRADWEQYVAQNFGKINNPKVQVVNMWDSSVESAFHKKYAVLTTPALFLLDEDNRIIGRKLDCEALKTLIGQKDDYYSSLNILLNTLCEELELPDKETVDYIAEAFYERTINDPSLFRGTLYYIYNFFKGSNRYEYQQGAIALAEKYILGMADLWSSEMVDEISHSVELFNLNSLREKATDVVLYNASGCKKNLLSVNKSDYTILFFHLVKCSDCISYEKELIEMMPLLKEHNAKVVSVYVGPDKQEWKEHIRLLPSQWKKLRATGYGDEIYSKYDISIVPKIYILNKDKVVIAKDINPDTLKTFFEKN